MKITFDKMGIGILEDSIEFPPIAWALRCVICATPVKTAVGYVDEWYGYLPSK